MVASRMCSCAQHVLIAWTCAKVCKGRQQGRGHGVLGEAWHGWAMIVSTVLPAKRPAVNQNRSSETERNKKHTGSQQTI